MNSLDSINRSITYVTNKINTMEVAQILEFNPVSSTATIQLLVRDVLPTGVPQPAPLTLYEVPVRFPQMGNFVMYAPPMVGDVGYVHFSRTNWADWYNNANKNIVVTKSGDRMHGNNSCYFEVGGRNKATPVYDPRFVDKMHMVQGETGAQYITMDDEGIEIQAGGGTTVTITAAGAINIIASGHVNVTGDVIADGVSLKNHTHGYMDASDAGDTPRVTGTAATSPTP